MSNWRPNWKIKKAYKFPSEDDLHQWAWEFMRRCPEYELDIPEIDKRHHVKMTDAEIFENIQHYAHKYACDFTPRARPIEDNNPPIYSKNWVPISTVKDKLYVQPTHWSHMSARFDLSLPIKTQLWYVEYELKKAQESLNSKTLLSPKKLHIEKYPTYIRLLDALHAGASEEKISAYIYQNPKPDENTIKTIRSNIKAALQLRDFGFRQIPYLYTKHSRAYKKLENQKKQEK